ncbi:hypothetical protein C8R44DRAFT_750407 [Mycena epipterygia]|nr:hypothetical protein C8R44DRAFT_750407 [Mycena epipterygia]
MNVEGTPEQQVQWFKDHIKMLEEKASETQKQHKATVIELIDEAEELRYQLSMARGECKDTTAKLVEKEHQLYDIRQLVILSIQPPQKLTSTSYLNKTYRCWT